MSEIRVNNITNRDGSTGTTVAGIPVVDSTSHFVVPTGRTGQRYVDGGENIVRDGLVLHLDAKYSYPSKTGITTTTASLDPDVYTWYDLSGNGFDAEIDANGPTYSFADGGSFFFDGTNDYISVPALSAKLVDQMTVSVWFKQTDVSADAWIIGSNNAANDNNFFELFADESYSSFSNTFTWRVTGSTSADDRISFANDSQELNTWMNLTGTWVVNKELRGYKNGVEQGNSPKAQAVNQGVLNEPGGLIHIGVRNSAGSDQRWFDGNIAIVQIYNRALTASEVLQNYNALKDRFGL
jgi:hypothetical protein